MFHRHTTKSKLAYAKPLKDLTAIIPSPQLLLEGKRRELLKNITEFSALESSRFESLCLTLVHNLINHCQSMPETSNSYYALPGGLLDHALNRTEAALGLFREYIVPGESGELSEEQKLWLYALFSAAILQGIGKLQIDYRVDLFDVNGQLLKQWNPLLESMSSVASYYQFEFQPEGDENLRRRLNLLIARLLMPASGFAWIISNPQVLAIWLALLNEDTDSAGTLGAILIRADAIAIQRYFQDVIAKTASRSGRGNRIGTFVDNVPETVMDKRLMGVEFIKWLSEQLAKGVIMINKAPLFMVPGGMLMSEDMFKLFVREHPEFKNWQAEQVKAGFLSLGLHRLGTDGNILSRFEQANTQHMQTGIVFAEYGVALPESMKIHNLKTGQISSISATELIHMAQFNQHNFNRQEHSAPPHLLNHLTQNGQWQPPAEAVVASHHLGNKRGG